MAAEPENSGFNELELSEYRKEVDKAISIRDAVRLHSGDAVDLKLYEPAMRHLIDTYIRAEDSEVISHLDDISLIDLVERRPTHVVHGPPNALRVCPGTLGALHQTR